MNAFVTLQTAVLQTALAAAPASPVDEGRRAAGWAAIIFLFNYIVSPAWVWGIYALVAGAFHCLVGYRFLVICVVLQMAAFVGGVLAFIGSSPSMPLLNALIVLCGTAFVMFLIVFFFKYAPAIYGFFLGVLAVVAFLVLGLSYRPHLLIVLPFGILGAWVAWKYRRAAYIASCVAAGAQAILWGVVTLVQTWVFGSFPVYMLFFPASWLEGRSVRGLYDLSGDLRSTYEMSGTLRAWNTAMFILLVLIGLWVQFRYADRWDYGTGGRPGEATPEGEIPSIFPGADTESHTGYGYVERPKQAPGEPQTAGASAEDPAAGS